MCDERLRDADGDVVEDGKNEHRTIGALQFLIEHGPADGLEINMAKSHLYIPDCSAEKLTLWEDAKDGDLCTSPIAAVIEEELKISVSGEGFDSYLGAPFSIRKHHGRAKQLAVEQVQSLRQELDNISYLQNPQLEFLILKYCFCPKINHLCRLLPHDVMAPAIAEFDKLLKSGLASCTKAPIIPDDALEQAKQPVRTHHRAGAG